MRSTAPRQRRTGKRTRTKNAAFTLIELLIVMTIIVMLAAIMLPSLSAAREMARAGSCLSNMHNIGMALQVYQSDNRGYFPSTYNYIDGNSSAGGYRHWTSLLHPEDYTADVTAGKYPRTSNEYVCPSHIPQGFAPTNFTSTRIPSPPPGQATQTAGQDDKQAARLSYLPNEVIMPRKKFSSAHDAATPPGTSNLCLVRIDEVEGAANTILLGEFSNSANCIYGSSGGGGDAYKSHRPTNGMKVVGGGVFDGENYATGTQCQKLTAAEAEAAISAVLASKSAGATSHHISYINDDAHKTGSNYTFVDGHAGKYTLDETFDPGNYMWGRKVYSCVDKPVIQDN